MRFLSILDNYDSEDYKGVTAGVEHAMRSIINSYYPKMISQSTKASQHRLLNDGKYAIGTVPFGYKKDSEERYKLVLDEEPAKIIREIFNLALDKVIIAEIVRRLNESETISPSDYKKHQKEIPITQKTLWSKSTVKAILQNYAYTGAVVSQKTKVVVVGSRKTVPNKPVIVEDMHEAIISKLEFRVVQEQFVKRKKKPKQIYTNFLLNDYVFCGSCGLKMKRELTPSVFTCVTTSVTTQNSCIKRVTVSEKILEDMVLKAILEKNIQLKSSRCQQEKDTKNKVVVSNSTDSKMVSKDIRLLKGKINQQKHLKRLDYEKFCEEQLAKADFLKEKAIKDDLIEKLEIELEEKEALLSKLLSAQKKKNTPQGNVEKDEVILTQAMVKKYLKAVYIYDLDKVEVELKT